MKYAIVYKKAAGPSAPARILRVDTLDEAQAIAEALAKVGDLVLGIWEVRASGKKPVWTPSDALEKIKEV